MKLKPVLSLSDGIFCADAARAYLSGNGQFATIVIVDRGGAPVYVERHESQGPNSIDMALGKARAAAFRERPSVDLEERVKERPGFLMTPNQIGVRGGIPLFFAGECVGGIGVSGVGKHDEAAAKAAENAFTERYKGVSAADLEGDER